MATKVTLLVVDDDQDVLTALRIKLERTGRYNILTAVGGQEALRRVREGRQSIPRSW